MSVSNVTVFDYNTTAPIKAADIKPGSDLRIEVDGFTSLAKVPVAGTWRIYDMVRSCPGGIASHPHSRACSTLSATQHSVRHARHSRVVIQCQVPRTAQESPPLRAPVASAMA